MLSNISQMCKADNMAPFLRKDYQLKACPRSQAKHEKYHAVMRTGTTNIANVSRLTHQNSQLGFKRSR